MAINWLDHYKRYCPICGKTYNLLPEEDDEDYEYERICDECNPRG